MKVVLRIAMVPFLILAIFTVAKAETVELRAKLLERVSELEEATLNQDFWAITQLMPPRILDVYASRGGVSRPVLQKAIVKRMEEVVARVTVHESVLMTGRTTFHPVSDKLLFAVIPMRFVVQVGNGSNVEADEQQIAVYGGSNWYLMRVANSAHRDAFVQAYPSIVGTSFERTLNTIANKSN